MNWAVIMAGGNGTRFWPLSNTEHPKQFLRLLGEKTPAESCLERLQKVIPIERIIIVASAKHKDSLQNALPSFPLTQVLWEPIGRNTAACIAWATEVIRQKDHNARIGVFPSDHAIADENAFAQSLTQAYEAAQNRIVLFGIEPSHPETGYGYIEEGENIANNLCKGHPLGALLSSALFGFTKALAQVLQNSPIKQQILECIPYIATIAAMAIYNVIIKKRAKAMKD